jgi:Zn-dependent peptidase ImmA (M78 family)
MHEFKHVLDHTTKQFLYHDRPFQTADEQAERVADYFAACLLMPKRVVKRLWCQGNQNMVELAKMLFVSTRALRYRLDQLGLLDPPTRCRSSVRYVGDIGRPAIAGRL